MFLLLPFWDNFFVKIEWSAIHDEGREGHTGVWSPCPGPDRGNRPATCPGIFDRRGAAVRCNLCAEEQTKASWRLRLFHEQVGKAVCERLPLLEFPPALLPGGAGLAGGAAAPMFGGGALG